MPLSFCRNGILEHEMGPIWKAAFELRNHASLKAGVSVYAFCQPAGKVAQFISTSPKHVKHPKYFITLPGCECVDLSFFWSWVFLWINNNHDRNTVFYPVICVTAVLKWDARLENSLTVFLLISLTSCRQGLAFITDLVNAGTKMETLKSADVKASD